MKKKWIIWAVVGLLVLLMACGSKSKTTTVTAPTPEPQRAETVTRSLPEDPEPTAKPTPTAKPDPTPEPAREYVLNTSSKKFHKPTCSSVEDIKPENKELVECTRAELIEQGYDSCGRCHP